MNISAAELNRMSSVSIAQEMDSKMQLLTEALWECYRLAGGSTTGDGDWSRGPAVMAVERVRSALADKHC